MQFARIEGKAGAHGGGRVAMASSTANVAQTWESSAPLSSRQQSVLDLLSQPCARFPFDAPGGGVR